MPVVFTNDDGRVVAVHMRPDASHLQRGHEVEDIPALEADPGKIAVLHYTPEEGFWAEQVPDTSPSGQITALQGQVDQVAWELLLLQLEEG